MPTYFISNNLYLYFLLTHLILLSFTYKLILYDAFKNEAWVNGNACGVLRYWKGNPLWI